MNVEVYQGLNNKKYNTKFKIPVVYYSQLMVVAYGASAKGETEGSRTSAGRHTLDFQAKHDSAAQKAGLDGNIVRASRDKVHRLDLYQCASDD